MTAAALIEAAILSWVQWQNYLGFNSSSGDLGNYNQMFYTTTHGEGFFAYTTNISGGTGGTIWGTHFVPTLVLITPIYALAASPVTLLVIKEIALCLGAVPLYALARVYFRDSWVPGIVAGIYLLNPLVIAMDWNQFDPEVLAPVLILTALYLFAIGRFWPFLAFWVLALGTIESVPPLLIAFAVGGLIGTFLVASRSPYWTSAQQRVPLVAALGVAAGWLGLSYASLQIAGRGGAFGSTYAARYTTLGATSLPDVVLRTITHPHLAIAALQDDGSLKLAFLIVVALSWGMVWLFGGLRYVLPVAAFLSLVVLSSNAREFAVGSQYPALIMAFLAAGTVEGLALLSDWFRKADPTHRRQELIARLTAHARGLAARLAALPAAPDGGPTLAALRSVAEHLRAGDLVRSERLLQTAELAIWRAERRAGVGAAKSTEGRQLPVRIRASIARRRPRGKGEVANVAIILAVVVLAFTSFVLANPLQSSPLGGGSSIVFGLQGPDNHDQQLQSVLDIVPASAPLLTTARLFPQLSNRADAYVLKGETYQLPPGTTIAAVLDGYLNQSNYVALDYWNDPTLAVQLQNLTNLTSHSEFGVRAAVNGSYLWQRGWTGAPSAWSPWKNTWAGGQMTPNESSLSDQYGTALGPSLYHAPGGTIPGSMWTGPRYLYLPPGQYSATFELVFSTHTTGNQFKLSVVSTPAVTSESSYLQNGGYNYYRLSTVPLNVTPPAIGSYTFSTPASIPQFEFDNVTVDFTWSSAGYVSFPGMVLSPELALYLVQVSVVQTSAIV